MLEAIDWTAPWLAPWRARGEAVAHSVRGGMAQPTALNQAALAPVCFVPQSELPSGVAYEQYIFDTAHVPTRDGLHDFFNGLVWHAFPLTKRRLNALQAAQIKRSPAASPGRAVASPGSQALCPFAGAGRAGLVGRQLRPGVLPGCQRVSSAESGMGRRAARVRDGWGVALDQLVAMIKKGR